MSALPSAFSVSGKPYFGKIAMPNPASSAARCPRCRPLSRLETRNPIDLVKRQAGVAAQIHALAGEYRTHAMLGGELEAGLVRLRNIDEELFAQGIIAKRAEQGLGDVGRIGKKRPIL